MSAPLHERLDPAGYLPAHEPEVSSRADKLARAILAETYPGMDYQHCARSALAGSALYLASVVVDGADSVSQTAVADVVGTTTWSVRHHTGTLAELTYGEMDSVALKPKERKRLQKITDTGSVKSVKIS